MGESEEDGGTKCLGIIPGTVKYFPAESQDKDGNIFEDVSTSIYKTMKALKMTIAYWNLQIITSLQKLPSRSLM